MSTLIPDISITEMKLLKVPELKRLKSCEIFADGQYIGTWVAAQTDYIRVQIEGLAQLSNSVGGEDIEQIKETANAVVRMAV